MAKATTTIRIDAQLKKRTQEIFKDLGMDFTTGITIYLHKVAQYGGIPFELVQDVPNDETKKAIAEVEDMKAHPENYKGYTSVDDMFEEILNAVHN